MWNYYRGGGEITKTIINMKIFAKIPILNCYCYLLQKQELQILKRIRLKVKKYPVFGTIKQFIFICGIPTCGWGWWGWGCWSGGWVTIKVNTSFLSNFLSAILEKIWKLTLGATDKWKSSWRRHPFSTSHRQNWGWGRAFLHWRSRSFLPKD